MPPSDIREPKPGQHQLAFHPCPPVWRDALFRWLAVLTPLLIFFSFAALGYHDSRRHEPLGTSRTTDSNSPTEKDFHGFGEALASNNINWQPCFREGNEAEFYCARLAVPMAASSAPPAEISSTQHMIHLALIMLPGRGHTHKQNFSSSPLIVNPGGPGIGGVDFVLWAGRDLQQLLGVDQDIIGFDSRGIGHSRPRADCWERIEDARSKEEGRLEAAGRDSAWRGYIHRLTWNLQKTRMGLPGLGNGAQEIKNIDAYARAASRLCRETQDQMGDNKGIFPYMGTEYTARDLLYIVDAWDAWRHGPESPSNPQPGGSDPTSASMRGKLVFWGFSYGSFLGTTFAALFPDRVGRLVLDGVVNAYENGDPFWHSSLRDTDKVLDRFFFECHEALSKCPLYRPGDSIADIRERYDSAVTTLGESPLWYLETHHHQPNVFALADFQKRIFAGLYYPLSSFVDIAKLVNCIFERDTFQLALIIGSEGGKSSCPNSCQAWMPPEYLPDDAGLACSCADKNEPMNQNISEVLSALEVMLTHSRFGDVWMDMNMGCNGWSINNTKRAMNRASTWRSQRGEKSGRILTAFPILFVGNSFDPVTPLADAISTAEAFQDSMVLKLEAPGHTSIATRSLCFVRALRSYLKSATLPEGLSEPTGYDGHRGLATCEVDARPFGNGRDIKTFMEGDGEILLAADRLQEHMSEQRRKEMGRFLL